LFGDLDKVNGLTLQQHKLHYDHITHLFSFLLLLA